MAAIAGGRGVFQVVGGQRVVAGGKGGAAAIGELVGVQLHGQAERLRAAANRRAIWAGVKAMVSQNASTASA